MQIVLSASQQLLLVAVDPLVLLRSYSVVALLQRRTGWRSQRPNAITSLSALIERLILQ